MGRIFPSFLTMQIDDRFILRSPLFPFGGEKINDTFLEAIYLTSPDLFREMKKNGFRYDQKGSDKLNITVYKYLKRSSTRCTPFGLFAGLSHGRWSNEAKIKQAADPALALTRKTRLDMNVVCALSGELEKKEFLRPLLTYYPNNSIYRIGDSYRYIEYYYEGARRFHKLSKVDHSEYLDLILTEAVKGKSISDLADLLVSDEISPEEAGAFILDLIDNQLLVSQLQPTVTGADFFSVLISELRGLADRHPMEELRTVVSHLEAIALELKAIDTDGGGDTSAYKKIHERIRYFLPEIGETNLFQTDLYKNTEAATIPAEVKSKLLEAVSFFNKITPAYVNTRLEDFKTRFHDRFENAEIPLLAALDSESGLGYPGKESKGVNELIDNMLFSEPPEKKSLKWDDLQSILHNKLVNALKLGSKVVELRDEDFKDLDNPSEGLPHSFSIMFKYLSKTDSLIQVLNIGGSSAVNLLGRFAGADPHLRRLLEDTARFEQRCSGNKILAEIVHLPESRTGNILSRPVIRDYEIPFLANGSASCKHQISLNDLTIALRNNKIILRSRSLNREIVPRLGNAHNYSANSLPVYHFLCDLQNQYFAKPFIGFDWGVLSNQYKFLPRAEYKKMVICPARWQLQTKDLKPLLAKDATAQKKLESFFDLKQKFDIPDVFYLVSGDNELLIDTREEAGIHAFIDEVKGKPSVLLEEFLFDCSNALLTDTENKGYANELIAVVHNEEPLKSETRTMDTPCRSKRIFSIGSEWLYLKIYCGVKTCDSILAGTIGPFAKRLLTEGLIDKWFFIRYGDPDSHIRFRLHVKHTEGIGKIILALNSELEPMVDLGVISKIQSDSYVRELERYGDNTIELAESFFCADSIFVCDLIDLLDPGSGGKVRWQIALRATDELLNDFGYTPDDKSEFMERLAHSFFQEYGGGKELKRQLDDKFRHLRKDIEYILDNRGDELKEVFPAIALLQERSRQSRPAVLQILDLKGTGGLQVPFELLMSSFIHMNLDRLFLSKNRTNEFVVCELLSRYYRSYLAKEKAVNKVTRLQTM